MCAIKLVTQHQVSVMQTEIAFTKRAQPRSAGGFSFRARRSPSKLLPVTEQNRARQFAYLSLTLETRMSSVFEHSVAQFSASNSNRFRAEESIMPFASAISLLNKTWYMIALVATTVCASGAANTSQVSIASSQPGQVLGSSPIFVWFVIAATG